MSCRLRIAAICTIAFCWWAGNAAAHPLHLHDVPVAAPLLHMITWHRSETHRIQRTMGVALTPTEHRERKAESTAFRMWILNLWKTRHQEMKKEWKQFLASWQAQERNAYKAIRASAAFWNVSYGWLVSCARSEGLGDGGSISWTPNGSGASGPFQFLSGTFAWMSNAAWSATARRGLHIPLVYKSWGSTVGQSWTAAWAFSHGHSSHWFGAGC